MAAGFPARGQNTPRDSPDVTVSSKAGFVHIEVSKTTPLSTVLSAFCKQQGMKCSGVELLSRYPVPPMAVEGPLTQVVADLLRHTGINFEFVHGAAGVRSGLVLGTAPAGDNRPLQASGVRPDEPSNPNEYGYSASMPLDTEQASTETPDLTPGGMGASGTQQATVTANSNTEAMLAMFKGGYATKVTPSAYLPFPDAEGLPIPANSTPATYLPFPDQFGNPIPVQPAKPGSPFPLAADGGNY